MIGPSRGDIWFVSLDPTKGREQAGDRTCLIISVDEFNLGPAELVTVIPTTGTKRNIPWHVEVTKNDGDGLKKTSYIMCENIRTISRERLICRTGKVSQKIINSIEDRLRILLDL